MTGNSMFEYVHAEDQQELGAVLNPNLAHRNVFDAISVLSPQCSDLLPPATPSAASTLGLAAPDMFGAASGHVAHPCGPMTFGANAGLPIGAMHAFDAEASGSEPRRPSDCPDGEDGAESGWPNVRYVSAHLPRAFVMRLKCVLAKRNAGITSAGYKVLLAIRAIYVRSKYCTL